MKLTENRPLACACLVLVILGTVFVGGGNRLANQRKAVLDVFNASKESISAELKEVADDAVVMGSIVSNAKGASQAQVDAVTSGVESLRAAETVAEKSDACSALTAAVENLYSGASNLSLSEKDSSDLTYRYRNYSSALLRISHDPYNDRAAAFNDEKAGFPASLICGVRGIKDADIFG